MSVTEQKWCRKCDDATKHVTVYREHKAIRPIDGDRIVWREPLDMCLKCFVKTPRPSSAAT